MLNPFVMHTYVCFFCLRDSVAASNSPLWPIFQLFEQVIVRQDIENSTSISSTTCVCGLCGLRLDSRDPILRLRLVIFINSALELVAIVSQVLSLAKDAKSGRQNFDPLKQSEFWYVKQVA